MSSQLLAALRCSGAARQWHRHGASSLTNKSEMASTSASLRRLFATSAGKKAPPVPEEEIQDPPSTFTSVFAMGAGAMLAVGVAAVGVIGAFKMALWAAAESGRSMDPKQQQPSSSSAAPTPPQSPDHAVLSSTKERLEERLAELRKLPRSPEVDAEKGALKQAIKAMASASAASASAGR